MRMSPIPAQQPVAGTARRDAPAAAAKRRVSKICTATDVHNAKATDKPIKLRCGNGLVLYVTPAGTKSWRCDYQLHKRHRVHVFGHYLQDRTGMSLADAKIAREVLRQTIRDGGDPAAQRQAKRIERAEADAATIVIAKANALNGTDADGYCGSPPYLGGRRPRQLTMQERIAKLEAITGRLLLLVERIAKAQGIGGKP